MLVSLHEQDFYAWTRQQTDALRSGAFSDLDVAALIEELESMGANEKRELSHRLALLIGHLLKWVYQPERRGNSWLATIKEQRLNIADVLQDNPSLKYHLEQQFVKVYIKAVLFAVRETDLPQTAFPESSPFTLGQVLDESFLPQS